MSLVVSTTIDRKSIEATYAAIRPHIRVTPILDLDARDLDLPSCPLTLKLELCQHSGSFKARGMATAVSRNAELGATGFIAPSAGNAAGALAAYAAAAGLPATVLMPVDAPEVNQVEALVCGAGLVLVDGLISDCGRVAAQLAARTGAFDVSTLKEPYRVKSKKTMRLELANQFGWELYDTTGTTEDWSYNATGGLGFTFEIGKGEGLALTGAGFHPVYPVGVIAEYFGKGPWAGMGNRSAYFIAYDWASQTANHALIEGRAKPGSELTLTKSFDMFTSPREDNNWTPISFTDTLVSGTEINNTGWIFAHGALAGLEGMRCAIGHILTLVPSLPQTQDYPHNIEKKPSIITWLSRFHTLN